MARQGSVIKASRKPIYQLYDGRKTAFVMLKPLEDVKLTVAILNRLYGGWSYRRIQ